ncbi:Carbohydrate Esterase Family 4 [Madurella fahalii]|uniref:Carbohydrate Esterase Family 4 n=1 Tax=Madurella fahalii TaxID=1157608 RepID=A0ABQ0GT15_9PEZI
MAKYLPTLLSIGLFLARAQAAPASGSTNGLGRRVANTVPLGFIIEHCTVPGVVALTFDDGPYIYTSHVLDLLDQYNASATFFVNGDNMAHNLVDTSTPWPEILRRMVRSGHQVGSHTMSHVDLTAASSAIRQTEVRELEYALGHILGIVPTYLRPPYGSCSPDCLREVEQMGYHVVNFDLDTKDYLHNAPGAIQTAMNTFAAALDTGSPLSSSFLVLSHDTLQYTTEALVPFMLEKIRERGYRTVTVGECLGDAAANWYRPPAV